MAYPTEMQNIACAGKAAVNRRRGCLDAETSDTDRAADAGTVSVIVPTRRCDEALRSRLRRLAEGHGVHEVLVVEPEDAAPPAPEPPGTPSSTEPLRLLRAPRGRGSQCAAGARVARGALLLFLHDDTELPGDALPQLRRAFADPSVGAACFRLRFDRDHWLLRLYARLSRVESVLTTFGDQGLAIRRALYQSLGGFPDWPLFEDVELARRVRRRSRIVKLRATVTTSALRFERNGMLRQQFLNGSLLLRFLLGADPQVLAARYERHRR